MRYNRSFRVLLDDDDADFVREEARRTSISDSAVIRQAVALRRSHARREAEIAEMEASHG